MLPLVYGSIISIVARAVLARLHQRDCNLAITGSVSGPCRYDTIDGPSIGQKVEYHNYNETTWLANKTKSFYPVASGCESVSVNLAIASLQQGNNITSSLTVEHPLDDCLPRDNGVACLWLKVVYTTFAVTASKLGCDRRGRPESISMSFPNIGNEGGGAYCQRDPERCTQPNDTTLFTNTSQKG